ncbi:unnamed protein product [Lepeophtheirus salmonis]|uniref:(salmon louse) hypothetical protein n=1 Tax=Lepeophtheirus salmonis TaxID=72036 RepID=A0A7R8CZX7_LEPSM|nr:unnamed protein product [Lepeophtheirus salmonis]CAF2978353.1 unnamed protein product [Lepeophtheirus salmonis]
MKKFTFNPLLIRFVLVVFAKMYEIEIIFKGESGHSTAQTLTDSIFVQEDIFYSINRKRRHLRPEDKNMTMSKNDTVDLVSSDEEDEERRERSPNRTVELSTSSSSSEEGPDEVSDEEEDEKFVTGISSPGKITTPVPESGPVQASSYVTSTPAAPTMRFSPNEEVFEGAGESEAPEEDILDELTEKHQRGVASRILDSTTDSTIVEKGDLDETLESKTTLRNANESINDPSNGNNKRKKDD